MPRTNIADLLLLPPHGILYIAAVLVQDGYKVKIVDSNQDNDYKNSIIKLLPEYDTIGITVNIATMKDALGIAKLIRSKSPESKIIMGGPHPTNVFSYLIPRYADVVVLGEGEDTIRELAKNNRLSEVEGIAYWHDNTLKVNKRRALIEDLDGLPFPALSLLHSRSYALGAVLRKKKAIMITSRGCPHRCFYCTKAVHGNKIRLRSVKNVILEIDQLVNHLGIKQIQIWDDNFTFYPDRVKELCKEIIKHNFHRKVRFIIPNGIRGDVYDEEMFKIMHRAGFEGVVVGIETGSQEMQYKIGHNLDLEMAKKTIVALKKAGLKVTLFFMIGLPFENEQTMQETIDFAKESPADNAVFFMATPFPGTGMYDLIKEEGTFLKDPIWGTGDYTSGQQLFAIGALKSKMAERRFYQAYKDYYLNLRKITDLFWLLMGRTLAISIFGKSN